MPNLDLKGKILFENPDRLSFCSSGSGAFLKSLNRDGLLKIMEGSGIEILNLVGTRNLNSRACDPVSIAFLHQKKLDCSFEGFRRESMNFMFPTVLEDSEEFLNMYYPHESVQANKENNSLFPKYGVIDLNMFIKLDHIKEVLKTYPAEIFKFRLKKKKVDSMKKLIKTNLEGMNDPLNSYSFELNAFAIVKLTKNVKMVIRDSKEAVLYLSSPESEDKFSEKEMIEKMREQSDGFIQFMTAKSPCKKWFNS